MTENNQLSVDRLISVLAEILSTDKVKVKIKLTNKKESPDSLAASGIQDDLVS